MLENIKNILEAVFSGIQLIADAVGSIFVGLNLVSTFISSSIVFLLGLAAYIPVWIYVVFMAMVVVAILFLVVGR